ncbi:MAG: hypothetical protein HUU18_01520 [Phycisphaerales bacterium]|nr:hypothetical protein [Phycisphaerales bacterium]
MRALIYDVLVTNPNTGQDRTVRVEADNAEAAQRIAAEEAGIAGPAVLVEIRSLPDATLAHVDERLRATQTQLARLQDTIDAIKACSIMRSPTRIIGSAVAYGVILALFLLVLLVSLGVIPTGPAR